MGAGSCLLVLIKNFSLVLHEPVFELKRNPPEEKKLIFGLLFKARISVDLQLNINNEAFSTSLPEAGLHKPQRTPSKQKIKIESAN